MSESIVDKVYPENRLFGFTREDGTTHFLTRVHALLKSDSTVLDVGCGRGQFVEDPCAFRRDLRRLGGAERQVIGIDVDPAAATNPMLDEFRLIDDPHRWPVADTAIDLVYSDYVLEHIQEPDSFFAEAARVLRPGGYLCLRTPNFLGYGAFITWLIPNRFHQRILARVQPDRKSIDVFPTLYRCNTRWRLMNVLKRAGFEPFVYSIEGEPSNFQSFRLVYRIAAVLVPHLPSMFKSTHLVFARKLPKS
jgi:SAM-dependent methyltransferase